MTKAQELAEEILNTLEIVFPGIPSTCGSQIEEYTSISHIKWMLKEILGNKLSSQTKQHRWLGYVQGVLVVQGIIAVSQERARTRNILRGA